VKAEETHSDVDDPGIKSSTFRGVSVLSDGCVEQEDVNEPIVNYVCNNVTGNSKQCMIQGQKCFLGKITINCKENIVAITRAYPNPYY
jgi:hypothetical protein